MVTGRTWVAQDENEADIAAYDPHKPQYGAAFEVYNSQYWVTQEKDEEAFVDYWNEIEVKQRTNTT